ncbi:MAG: BolA family protein [Pseudomonadota bacterium]
MTRIRSIEQILTEKFSPIALEVKDDSARHAGHAGASEAGETHFNVKIVSSHFDGMRRVDMQRAVMSALKSEFDSGLHALSIEARPANRST